ncbi:MAG: hypothetical protein KGJ62_10380 [Armatimonadetes bacterium]|nr:hypothetical protein [Armatimonadota bacterium]MDE2207170.1 hypothetical protein [Armatimonadota bacterium]
MLKAGNWLRRASLWTGIIGIAGASFSGCGGGGGAVVPPPPAGRAACATNAHQAGRAKWTVLIYMNAANDLQPYSLLNMGQIASVGSDANVNIVVQWKQAAAGTCSDPGCGNASFVGTRRYFIKQHNATDVQAIENGNTTVLDPDRLADPSTNGKSYNPNDAGLPADQSDMGAYQVLSDFVHWGVSNYPADNVMLLIWDHGSGWRPAYRSAYRHITSPKANAVSQDNETNWEIETWELPLALQNLAQPLDMIVFDASLEGMVEVAYELRNSARVMVGSEESPPGPGYPYDKWLTDLKADAANPCAVGTSIVKEFVNNPPYSSATDITQSVIDLSKMQAVGQAMETFGKALTLHNSVEATLYGAARDNAQAYDYHDNKDLYNYISLILNGVGTGGGSVPGTAFSDVKQAGVNLQAALTGQTGAVITAAHGSTGQANSNGLAVYVPQPGNYLTSYGQLALSQPGNAPDWAGFLQQQTK